jgi:hypothetical protein
MSADGITLAVGGPFDDNNAGASWVFSVPSGPLAAHEGVDSRASFFPNPVTNQLTVRSATALGTLRLFDGTGRRVFVAPYRNGQRVDLSPLAAGHYWLQLDDAPARPLLKR